MTVWLPHCLARADRPSQKDFKLGGPRCCWAVPGHGHRTGQPSGRRAIQVIQSAVTVPGGIGLTEALALAGRPGQKDFKLGGPRCSWTIPGRGHIGPSGSRAIQIIQSAVTVPGGIGLTEALARADRPSQNLTQNDFKLGCCCTVPGRGHRTGQPSGRQAVQVIRQRHSDCPERDRTH